ncbi:MAG: DUF2917 domain-containing protein [Comamonas sp.]
MSASLVLASPIFRPTGPWPGPQTPPIRADVPRPDVARGPVTSWRLEAGRAQTFVALRAGRLFVLAGRAWLTGRDAPLQPDADQVLCAGQALPIAARQALVIEPWPVAAEPLELAWQEE